MDWKKCMLIICAILCFRTVPEGVCGTVEQNVDQSLQLMESGNYDEAERILLPLAKGLSEEEAIRQKVYYALGRAYLGQRRTQEAVLLLRISYMKHFIDPEVIYHYALALLLDGKPELAEPFFSMAGIIDPELRGDAFFCEAVACLRMGKEEEALRYLCMAMTGDPESRGTRSSRITIEKIFSDYDQRRQRSQAGVEAGQEKTTKEKPWAVSVVMGADYDDNVALAPDSTILPEEISAREDWRFVSNIKGSYSFYPAKDHIIDLKAGYTGTIHEDLDEFDVDTLSMQLGWSHAFRPFIARVMTYALYNWVDSERYNWMWGIGPGLSWQQREWTWSDFDYSYGTNRYINTPVNVEEDRDSDTHFFSARQNFVFPSLLIQGYRTGFTLGMSHLVNNAQGASYESDSTGGTATFFQELPLEFSSTMGYSYRDIEYDNPNVRSTKGEVRADREHMFHIRVSKKVREKITAYAGFRYYDNNSNIDDFYEYDSKVYSLGVRFDF